MEYARAVIESITYRHSGHLLPLFLGPLQRVSATSLLCVCECVCAASPPHRPHFATSSATCRFTHPFSSYLYFTFTGSSVFHTQPAAYCKLAAATNSTTFSQRISEKCEKVSSIPKYGHYHASWRHGWENYTSSRRLGPPLTPYPTLTPPPRQRASTRPRLPRQWPTVP